MKNEIESTIREEIKITSGYIKRKKIRKVLEAIAFFETTKFIKYHETKNRYYSDFNITVCGEKELVKRIMIIFAALGDV